MFTDTDTLRVQLEQHLATIITEDRMRSLVQRGDFGYETFKSMADELVEYAAQELAARLAGDGTGVR
jgi:hypothetical protein